VALIIPLGFVTASNTSLIVNVQAPHGMPLRCNKVLVQAFKTANSNDYVFVGLIGLNKATGSQVVAVLQAGQSMVIGDELESDVIDPTTLAVDSTSGTAIVAGLLYQR
jgi:hypothetical protein